MAGRISRGVTYATTYDNGRVAHMRAKTHPRHHTRVRIDEYRDHQNQVQRRPEISHGNEFIPGLNEWIRNCTDSDRRILERFVQVLVEEQRLQPRFNHEGAYIRKPYYEEYNSERNSPIPAPLEDKTEGEENGTEGEQTDDTKEAKKLQRAKLPSRSITPQQQSTSDTPVCSHPYGAMIQRALKRLELEEMQTPRSAPPGSARSGAATPASRSSQRSRPATAPPPSTSCSSRPATCSNRSSRPGTSSGNRAASINALREKLSGTPQNHQPKSRQSGATSQQSRSCPTPVLYPKYGYTVHFDDQSVDDYLKPTRIKTDTGNMMERKFVYKSRKSWKSDGPITISKSSTGKSIAVSSEPRVENTRTPSVNRSTTKGPSKSPAVNQRSPTPSETRKSPNKSPSSFMPQPREDFTIHWDFVSERKQR